MTTTEGILCARSWVTTGQSAVMETAQGSADTSGLRETSGGRRDTGADSLARMGGRAHQGGHRRGREVRPSWWAKGKLPLPLVIRTRFLPLSKILYKWSRVVCTFLCLAFSIQTDFEIHVCNKPGFLLTAERQCVVCIHHNVRISHDEYYRLNVCVPPKFIC